MNRTLCIATSLSIIASSLGGCASPGVQAPYVGPQVFGYTLNQPLSGEELQAFKATGFGTLSGLRVFARDDTDGGVIEVYLDRQDRPGVIRKKSRPFASEEACQAEFGPLKDQLQNRIVLSNAATRAPNSEGRARNVGDRYASLSSDACQAGRGESAGSYAYGLDAKLERAEAPKAKRSLGDKFDDAYIGAWTTVFVIALLPLVLIGLAVDKATD